jgi:CTD kinase subunit gamma
MSDPFEARMRFTSMLRELNATTTAAHKAALYALKFKDYDEDFQSCILEQLGRVCLKAPHLHRPEKLLLTIYPRAT